MNDPILAAIAEIAALTDSPLSTSFYDRNRRPGMVSARRVIQVWGTWSAANAAAGVISPAPSRSYSPAWSHDDVVAAVRRYLTEADTSSYAGYEKWRKSVPEPLPSAGTVRSQMGCWANALEQARGGSET